MLDLKNEQERKTAQIWARHQQLLRLLADINADMAICKTKEEIKTTKRKVRRLNMTMKIQLRGNNRQWKIPPSRGKKRTYSSTSNRTVNTKLTENDYLDAYKSIRPPRREDWLAHE